VSHGSPAIKLAITVDRDVHAKVVRAAAREHKSVSAWMTDAARRALLVRDGLAAVAEWEAEHGAFTEVELSDARRRVFGGRRQTVSATVDDRRPRRPRPIGIDAVVIWQARGRARRAGRGSQEGRRPRFL